MNRREQGSIVAITHNPDEGRAIRKALALLKFGDRLCGSDTIVITPTG